MIGKISGRLDYRAEDHILIDVRGVGYLVYVSQRVMAGLPGLVRLVVGRLLCFSAFLVLPFHRVLLELQRERDRNGS